MPKFKASLLLLAIGLSIGAAQPGRLAPIAPPSALPPFDGNLSVLTYNIHGVPWPVAFGRSAKLGEIASKLKGLRASGQAPHIVVIQEAFTTEAQSIGRAAGYRFVVDGPSVATSGTKRAVADDPALAAGQHWWKGEGIGKYVGSGLQILSDYPISDVHQIAYPQTVCAGYDCLANKGALLARISVPGLGEPIDVVTTHLNSRHASRVSDERSLRAYSLQIACLTDFIRRAHDPSHALIVAGDFNVGSAVARRNALLKDVRSRWSRTPAAVHNAFDTAAKARFPMTDDALFSRRRARDWQFYASGRTTFVQLAAVDVPFGHEAGGGMLSDHIGYTAVFRVSERAATRRALPTA